MTYSLADLLGTLSLDLDSSSCTDDNTQSFELCVLEPVEEKDLIANHLVDGCCGNGGCTCNGSCK